MACCRSGHNFVREQLKSWDVNKQLLIYNCEDMLPANYDTEKYVIVGEGLLLDDKLETIKLIVVRDLLNWWASYLKWGQKTPFILTPEKIRNAFIIWNAHVLEANLPRYMDPSLYCEYDDFRTSMSNRIALCNKIDGLIKRYREGESSFLCISVPPRHSKSQIVSRHLPAYFKGLFPDSEIMVTGYAENLLTKFSKDSRDKIVNQNPYRQN